MIQQVLISIVVPCYNAQEYLTMCMESILNQTHSNLEIILVDDGSSDNTPWMCDNYAESDKRVKVLHCKNRGASAARNIGLSNINGQYVMFVDSDDWIEPNTCEKALSVAVESGTDIVIWSYLREFETITKPKLVLGDSPLSFNNSSILKLQRRLVGLYEDELSDPQQADSLITVWGKLYKRTVLEGISFVDMSIIGTEDVFYNILVFGQASSAEYIPECLYHYRKTNTNSLTTSYTDRIFSRWKNLFNYIEDYLKRESLPDSFYQALRNRISLCLIGLGINLAESKESFCEKISVLRGVLNDPVYRSGITTLEIRYLPLIWKVFFVAVKARNVLSVYLMLMAMKILRRR